MVDYDFYIHTYLGSVIPEKAFPGAAAQAARALERFERIYRVSCSGTESRAMAVCAMAEAVFRYGRRAGGVSAATSGEVSVRYDSRSPERALERALFDSASVFLDIRRGVVQ